MYLLHLLTELRTREEFLHLNLEAPSKENSLGLQPRRVKGGETRENELKWLSQNLARHLQQRTGERQKGRGIRDTGGKACRGCVTG